MQAGPDPGPLKSAGNSLNRIACIEGLVQADDSIHPGPSTINPLANPLASEGYAPDGA